MPAVDLVPFWEEADTGKGQGMAWVTPEIEIVHRDDSIVAVSKPGGLLCHRSAESRDRVFLLQEVRRRLGAHLYPVHRLDRAASGILVMGLSPEAARGLQQALASPDARKEYLVVVRGSTPERWESSRPLTSDTGVVRPARTEFERIAEFSRLSLLRARLRTGRRHQIRRHLAHEAHQVLGDTTYGKGRINRFFRDEFGLPRLFLHASTLELRHPVTGRSIALRSPLAADLREFLGRLPDVPPGLVETL